MTDQYDLVASLRKRLFPYLYEPGHWEANDDGWLRIDRIGINQHDAKAGMERGALWAKHIAWERRDLELGVVKAKPGSENHGGANSISPEVYNDNGELISPGGFTTDIVATPNGVHWDFQIDSGGKGYPCWVMEDDPDNYPPVARRYVPAFPPDTK